MRDSLTIETDATVNEILAQYPATVATFNEFGIDACSGANVNALIAALDAAIRQNGGTQ